jgi:hypothetical protein
LIVRVTASPPIVGAALLGLDVLHASLPAQARLREELTAAVVRLEGDVPVHTGSSGGG